MKACAQPLSTTPLQVHLDPGQTHTLTFTLPPRAFAFYDVHAHDWYVEPGEFDVLIAASVTDVRLSSRVTVTGTPRATVGGADIKSYIELSDAQLASLGLHVTPPPSTRPIRRSSLVKDVREHGGCCGQLFYRAIVWGNEVGDGEVSDPGEARSRKEMLTSLPLQQLQRFAHCDSSAARYAFTDMVLDGLIGCFNLSGGSCCASMRDGKQPAAANAQKPMATTSTRTAAVRDMI